MRFLGLAAIAALVMAAPTMGAQADKITIGTGGPTGLYFVTGKNICKLAGSKGQECEAKTSGGSVANLKALHAGDIDVAIVQSDWQYHAYRGSSQWEAEKMPELRSLFSAHAEPLQIVASKKSGIKKFKDLNKKRINIGNPGSGSRSTVEIMFEQMRIQNSAFAEVSEFPSGEQVDRFCADEFDAFFFAIGIPNGSMKRAVAECDGMIIEPDPRSVRKLATAARPYYAKFKIPKGTYRDDQRSVKTFGVTATVVARENLPDTAVEAILEGVFADLEAFKNLHPVYKFATPKSMIKEGLSAPLHPAAEAYYKKQGWL